MQKLIITIALLTSTYVGQAPKDITGKWMVENVEFIMDISKLPPQQKNMFIKSLKEPLTNAVFDFKADHHFYLSANISNMPKNDYWEYNSTDGTINIREYNNSKSLIMKIKIIQKDGNVFFTLSETPIILKMSKKE